MASIYYRLAAKTMTHKELMAVQVEEIVKKDEERSESTYQKVEVLPAVVFAPMKEVQILSKLVEKKVKVLTKARVGNDIVSCPQWRAAQGDCYSFAQTFNASSADDRFNRIAHDVFGGDSRYVKYLTVANKFVASGGTLNGFITRYLLGASKPDLPFLSKQVVGHCISQMAVHFPLGTMKSLEDQTLADVYSDTVDPIVINTDAKSGLPFMDDTKSSYAFHYTKATEFFLALKQGEANVRQYLTDNNWFSLYVAKNKNQLYSREDLWNKTRPYFVLPNAKKLLYMSISQRMCDALRPFTEEGFEESSSAYHFSWFNQGQEKLWDRLQRYKCKPGQPDFIVYGDDSWVFWWEGENLKIVALDISMLDGSVRDVFKPMVEGYIHTIMEPYIDPTWKKVLTMMTNELFSQQVVLNRSVIVERKGIPSGVPLTTFADMCVMSAYFSILFLHSESFEGMTQEVLNSYLDNCTKITGLQYKSGTNLIRVVSEDRRNLPAFLGMVPDFDLGYPVFEDYDRLIAKMFHPGEEEKGKKAPQVKFSAALSRCMGIMLCGGYHYPDFYEVVKKYYYDVIGSLKALGVEPLPIQVSSEIGSDWSPVYEAVYEEYIKQKVFPEVEWFRAFYTMEDPEQAQSYSETPTVSDVRPVDVQNIIRSDLFYDSSFSSQATDYAHDPAQFSLRPTILKPTNEPAPTPKLVDTVPQFKQLKVPQPVSLQHFTPPSISVAKSYAVIPLPKPPVLNKQPVSEELGPEAAVKKFIHTSLDRKRHRFRAGNAEDAKDLKYLKGLVGSGQLVKLFEQFGFETVYTSSGDVKGFDYG